MGLQTIAKVSLSLYSPLLPFFHTSLSDFFPFLLTFLSSDSLPSTHFSLPPSLSLSRSLDNPLDLVEAIYRLVSLRSLC